MAKELVVGVKGSGEIDAVTRSLNSLVVALASLPPEIQRVNSSLKGLDKSLDSAGKEGDGLANSNKKLKSSNESLVGSLLKVNVIMEAVNLAMRALKAAFFDSIQSAAAFNKVFANVTTLVDTATVNTTKMERELLQLDNRLGSATELSKGLYQALSASVDASEAVKFVGEAAKFAKAALTDTETAVDVLTTTLNAYGMATSEVTHISDVFFQTIKLGKINGEQLASTLGTVIPLAANLDVSIEELGASMAVFTKQGINAANAATRINATMTAFLKPSKAMIGALKELGFESGSQAVKELGGLKNAVDAIIDVTGLSQGELKGFQDEMIKIQKEAKSSEEETRLMEEAFEKLKESTGASKDAIAQLFPSVRALQGALTLTGEGAKDFEKILDSITNTTGSTDVAFEKQKLTFDAMNNSLNKTAIAFGNVFIPALEKAAIFIEAASDSFRGFIEDTSGAKLILIIGGIATAIGVAIVSMGGLSAAAAIASGAFASIQASIISLTVTMAANPFLLVIIAITALATITAAYIISSNDLNNINKKLTKSTGELSSAVDKYKKVNKQLTVENDKLNASEKTLLGLQREQLKLNVLDSIQGVAKEYNKLNRTRTDGISKIQKEKDRISELTTEMESLALVIDKARAEGKETVVAIGIGIQPIGGLITTLATGTKELAKLKRIVADSDAASLSGTIEIAKALAEQVITESDLIGRIDKESSLYIEIIKQKNIILENLKLQEEAESKLIEEQKNQIKLSFEQNVNEKNYQKLLEDRASFIEDMTQKLKEQNKTELELLNMKEQAELATVSLLFKGHRDFEMRKNQVTQFYENEKINLIKKTNEEINAEFGKTALEIEKAGKAELDILLRNGADKVKATQIIEDRIMKEKVSYGVATNSEMEVALQQFIEIKKQIDRKDFDSFEQFTKLKQEADKTFQNNGLQSYLEYQLAISAISQAQFDELTGKQEEATSEIANNFSVMSNMAKNISSSIVTDFGEAFNRVPAIVFDASKLALENMSKMFDVMADKSSTTGDKIMAGITAGLEAAGSVVNMVFAEITKQNDASLEEIEKKRISDIESLQETEKTKVEIAQEALTEAEEGLALSNEIVNEERALALEEYASHLTGMTDEDINRALMEKEIEIASTTDSRKIKNDDAIKNAKMALEKAKAEEKIKKANEAQIKAIEEQAAADKRAIQMKQFNEEKALAIAQIWIAAGVATMLAWAGSMSLGMPAGAIMAAIMSTVIAGMAIAQTVIVSQQTPSFATGVTGFGGGTALVGEEGPELVTLSRGSNVLTNENTNKILGGLRTGVADSVDSRDFVTVANIYLDNELIEQRTIENRRFSENRIGED